MLKHHLNALTLGVFLMGATPFAFAQPFDILSFDPTSTGPWSERGKTTLTVPKVANGSVALDGSVTSQEYGGSAGTTVTPGVNAWILDFPDDRAWDGPNDSSFTFFLAHDDDYFYVGVNVKDDVINSDDPNATFWKDDAIEIVVDALSDRYDNNTDLSNDPYGGHSYINFQGRFSAWDEAGQAIGSQTWASGVPWTYGANGDVFGFGKAVAGGWSMEVRFKKRLFQDPAVHNKLKNGFRMGFNIGLDDDDKHGLGTNGDKSRTEDLEIQYFWANRQRYKGFTAEYWDSLSAEDKASKAHFQNLEFGVDSAGRLAHGGTGEIFFDYDSNRKSTGKILFVTSNADSPINADAALIAFLRSKGYAVTPFTAGVAPDALRAAAAGQDLVILSETIGSTSILDPLNDATGVFALKNSDVPVISFEAYMFDNADWVTRTPDGSNDWLNWGNTGRSELIDPEIQDARDSLYIRKASHQIAGGLTGKVTVYNPAYSFNFGLPSADADVVASVQPDGSYPTILVYDKGDKLADGSVAPNKRIGLFLGQAANPNANTPTDFADLTWAGRKLILNTIAYALNEPPRKKILFVTSNADTLPNADADLVDFFESKGYDVTRYTSGTPPDDFRAAAAANDVVFISETIGSTSVLDPVGDGTGIFSLKDSDVPIISAEAYMFDNADWVLRTADGVNDWIHWGNTGRAEVDAAVQDARDSLYIQKANHPIAAGLTGKVQTYIQPYSYNFGVPSADADVVASVQPDGSYPTLFVYEKGDKLVDGSVAPNKRIGLFLGQAADPNANTPPDVANLTAAGKTLLANTLSYALGAATSGEAPTISISGTGNTLSVTFTGGTLQSADALSNTTIWKDETSATSPYSVTVTSGGKKFYRAKGK
jgi:hypothetical protein